MEARIGNGLTVSAIDKNAENGPTTQPPADTGIDTNTETETGNII